MNLLKLIRFSSLALVSLASIARPCLAGIPAVPGNAVIDVAPEKSITLAQRWEHLGRLYRNDDNPIIQELWFLGRYHGQENWSDSNTGLYNESWESRRFRLGVQVRLFKKLTLHAQMVSGSDFEPFYNGFTELWAQWSFSKALNLTVGQQKHRYTWDRNVSSRYLNYMERAMLTNLFALDYTPAVTLSGNIGHLNYYTGIFSNATGRDMGKAFTELDSGWSCLAALTYDFQHSLGTDTAYVNLSYVHSDANANATLLNRFENGISAALILTKGPASLVTELTCGFGGTMGDAQGINIQPGVFLTDRLQFVTRYQRALSDQPDGLRAQRRYERTVGLTTGDQYQAGYAGLNYYIAGNRLKLMTGAEYSTLGGRDCWTAMFAVRLFWGPNPKGPFPVGETLPGLW